MGLDQYAYAFKPEPGDVPMVDIVVPETCTPFFRWRKHANLQGYMEQIYRDRGGKEEVFNSGATVRLDLKDLENFEAASSGKKLPHTTGFFFGVSQPEDYEADQAFIHAAIGLLKEGMVIVYDSWW